VKRADVRSYLEDILENARLAKELIGAMSYHDFLQDIRTRLAVERHGGNYRRGDEALAG
jgi:uncharacterized protein with HEPN domain